MKIEDLKKCNEFVEKLDEINKFLKELDNEEESTLSITYRSKVLQGVDRFILMDTNLPLNREYTGIIKGELKKTLSKLINSIQTKLYELGVDV